MASLFIGFLVESKSEIRNPPFFYRLLSGQVCPENSRDIGRFLAILSLKTLRNLSFFSATYQKPCLN